MALSMILSAMLGAATLIMAISSCADLLPTLSIMSAAFRQSRRFISISVRASAMRCSQIEMNRLLCLKAADMMDKVGNKSAQLEIAMIKVTAPNMALKIIDNAIQAYGGAGVSDEAGLARDYASMRTMRLADGPDEVHNRAIARLELRKYANTSH